MGNENESVGYWSGLLVWADPQAFGGDWISEQLGLTKIGSTMGFLVAVVIIDVANQFVFTDV